MTKTESQLHNALTHYSHTYKPQSKVQTNQTQRGKLKLKWKMHHIYQKCAFVDLPVMSVYLPNRLSELESRPSEKASLTARLQSQQLTFRQLHCNKSSSNEWLFWLEMLFCVNLERWADKVVVKRSWWFHRVRGVHEEFLTVGGESRHLCSLSLGWFIRGRHSFHLLSRMSEVVSEWFFPTVSKLTFSYLTANGVHFASPEHQGVSSN